MSDFIKLTITKCNLVEQTSPNHVLTTDSYTENLYIRPCDIERIKRMKNATFLYCYGNEKPTLVNETPEEIFKLINEATTVPNEIVKHAHWVKSDIPCEEWRCSNCGGACWYYEHTGHLGKSNYCPNCGAKMDLTF